MLVILKSIRLPEPAPYSSTILVAIFQSAWNNLPEHLNLNQHCHTTLQPCTTLRNVFLKNNAQKMFTVKFL
jgi:hypothetical protein